LLGLLVAIESAAGGIVVAAVRWTRRGIITPIVGFLAVSLLFINLGFLWLYLRSSRDPAALTALLSTASGLIAVMAGGLLADACFARCRRRPLQRLSLSSINLDISYTAALSVGIAVIVVASLYFVFLGYLPLMEGVRLLLRSGFTPGLTNTPRILRDVYVNPGAGYIPLQGLLEAVRYFGLPIVAVWFVHYWRLGRHRGIASLMVVLSVLLVVGTGQRWPLMLWIGTLLIYWSIARRQNLTAWPAIFSTTVLVCSLGILLSTLLGRGVGKGASLGEAVVAGALDLAERIALGNATIPFESYRVFPAREPWLAGASWLQNLAAFLPGPAPSYPVTFYQTVTGDRLGFTAPPDFYTEAYINGGWTLLLVLSFAWGFTIVAIESWLAARSRALLGLSLSCLLTVLLAFTPISGLTFVLGGLIVVVGVWLGVSAVRHVVAIFGRSRLTGRLAETRRPGTVAL